MLSGYMFKLFPMRRTAGLLLSTRKYFIYIHSMTQLLYIILGASVLYVRFPFKQMHCFLLTIKRIMHLDPCTERICSTSFLATMKRNFILYLDKDFKILITVF